MTSLLFVHGIAQEGRSSIELKSEWVGALNKGLRKLKKGPVERIVTVPFYGDKLASWAKSNLAEDQERRSSEPKAGGVDKLDFSEFAIEFASEALSAHPAVAAQAIAIGLEETAQAHTGDFGKRGLQNWGPILTAVRLLDKALPSVEAAFVKQFLQTVHCYLTVNGAFHDTNGIIQNEIACLDGPTVVVGHSLGSVVTYHVLHGQERPADVPLYLTLGSPLALSAVRNRLRVRAARPPGVALWYNAFDKSDIVALNPLSSEYFPCASPIENYADVKNWTDNHHGVIGYLDDVFVAELIAKSIS